MLYKKFHDLNLSRLGMGAMRLPKVEGQGEKIEEAGAQALIDCAMAGGINYYDTAYRYHAGESEPFLGKALSRYPRESYYLATKLPGHMMAYKEGKYEFSGLLSGFPGRSPAELFEEQLEKCRTDYFDFYLLHNVCESAWDFYTDEEVGAVAYLLEQKKKGRIRYLGFSAHGRAEVIDAFLTKYPCFEFVQLQLNYLDWALQEAGKKYAIATKHGLPVIAMEPVRGGRLASLPPEAGALLKAARPGESIASWAFRFLQGLPNMQVALSGMSTLEQLKENIALFSKEDPVTPEEQKLLDEVVASLLHLVPCTACRYCVEGCPQGLDIPKLIAMYNEAANADAIGWFTLGFTLKAMAEEELPASCTGCGNCARICPQGIDIPGVMQKFAALLAQR